jgi:hypothetical protein
MEWKVSEDLCNYITDIGEILFHAVHHAISSSDKYHVLPKQSPLSHKKGTYKRPITITTWKNEKIRNSF